ncbi:group I intron-associated PD-(D/E)XK endonuclease [Iningainema tapete]|nr:group I intron-associated PD-(D/E)XK endonuclease [Iningainema tapete]
MDTKLKGDIAEQAAVFHALKRGWGVLKPVGDGFLTIWCLM